MKAGIQFNSYDGMGGKLQTNYRVGYIELNQKNKTGSVWCEEVHDLPEIRFAFNLQHFEITDMLMAVKGTNQEGYGKVDMCFDVNSWCHKLALENNERGRLQMIYNNTPGYYEKSYGDIKDIDKLAQENIQVKAL